MKIVITFRDEAARRTEYYLQRRYKSKKNLQNLAKLAVLTEAAAQAKLELDKEN